MRLIDADALIQKRSHAKVYGPEMYVVGQGYIMAAPTIDTIRREECQCCTVIGNILNNIPTNKLVKELRSRGYCCISR